MERQFSERHVDRNTPLPSRRGVSLFNLLGKGLELPVQFHSSSSLFLFSFKLVFVPISVLALSILRFVKGHLRCFAEKLHIFRLPLTDEDRIFQMNVDENNAFADRRLKKQVLDIRKDDVDMFVS